jgi:hypothetical protein
MFESKSGILLIGGLGFFLFAFLSNALVPVLLYQDLPEKTVAQLAENQNLIYQFEDLRLRYPEQFKKYYGEANPESLAKALQLGHDVYVAEGCWHCHSQFVRPVSNESVRWGKVASSPEYQNRLQRPVLWGTRRVGPDLSREGGRRGNDWHAVHFFDPPMLSPGSPMPAYPWFYDDNDAGKPNERGLAIITYVQWLGSWLEQYPLYERFVPIDQQMLNPLE